ncbi:metal ABC transporter permease [Kineococcus terrestris]|uniref:metal ABC transporter permease n=1 Tax=Kineococcus terrestris TaxID=2044856 RepID=UPI0034DB2B33
MSALALLADPPAWQVWTGLEHAFMQRALVAAVLVGLTAPLVGVFVVQRGMALVGDGIGHVALAGVASGLLLGWAPVATALVAACAAALAMEAVRHRRGTGGDVALAVIFYGGIAGGVVLMGYAPPGGPTLESYLFGAVTTTSTADLVSFAVLAGALSLVVLVLRPWLFSVTSDEEHARATGVPVRLVNGLLGVLVAVTVVLSMRTVGLLLISALVVLPVAAAQRVARSSLGVLVLACAGGVLAGGGGVVTSYWTGTPTGGTVVLLSLASLAVVVVTGAVHGRLAGRRPRRADVRPPAAPDPDELPVRTGAGG